METVLIVDNLKTYSYKLAENLVDQGCRCILANNGRSAIRQGIKSRPDILITDWLLEDDLDGFAVDEALKIINPRLKTVMLTNFYSKDLKNTAERNNITNVLEKPFNIGSMKSILNQARLNRLVHHDSAEVGFLTIDADGNILYGNYILIQFLRKGNFLTLPTSIDELCKADQCESFFAQGNYWRELCIRISATQEINWSIHPIETMDSSQTSFIVLAKETAPYLRNCPLVCNLLGAACSLPLHFNFDGHFLVVDDLDSVRNVMSESIRLIGGKVHTAANQAEAIRIFASDEKIKIVILDYNLSGKIPREVIFRMQEIRPQVKFIGTSGEANAADFAELGISDFLPKPWQIQDLINFLTDKIVN